MAIDVVYEGTVLARGTKMMSTPNGIFVEMEAPMPVGTQLTLEEDGMACLVRVDRVHEGVGPGVFVSAVSGALTLGTTAPAAADTTAAPEEPAAAEATAAPEAAPAADVTARVEVPAETAAAEAAPPVASEPTVAIDPAPHAEAATNVDEASVALEPAPQADEISQSGEVSDEMPPSDTEPVAIEATTERGDEHTVRDSGVPPAEAPKGGKRKGGKRRGGR